MTRRTYRLSPLTKCGSDKSDKDGQIIATVGGNNTDYTFTLYEGFNTSGTLVGTNATGIFNDLDSIHYTLVATATATGCFSTGATEVEIVKVPSAVVYPETLFNITPVNQTSCSSDSPNGEIIATLSSGNMSDYDFVWYKNVGGVRTDIATAEPTAVVNNNILSEVRQGNYVLEIISKITDCSGEKIITLYDDIVSGDDILLDLTPIAATRCTPPDGSISVSRVQITRDGGTTYTDGDIADYQFRWYVGNDTTIRVDETLNPSAVTANLVNVLQGQYTVVAFNPNTTCPSISYTGTIDGPDPLTFDFNPTLHGSSASADPCINPDGELRVEFVAGGSGTYTYQWFLGEGTDTEIVGATTDRLSGIRASKYTVEITDVATGCTTDSTFSLGAVNNLLPTPAAVLSDYAPSTSCDPAAYNGMLEVEVDPAVAAASYVGHNPNEHFFYYWFEGDRIKYQSPLPNTANLDDLNNYDVFRSAPNVTGFGGVISVDNKARIEDLPAGEYTVVVIDVKDYVENYKLTGTYDMSLIGCRAIESTFVVDEIAQSPVATVVADNNETCPGDGEIVVTVAKNGGDVTALTGYDFVWTDENSVVLASTENGADTESTLANLIGGRYTVTVTDRTTKCDTTFSIDIADNYTIGEISAIASNEVTTCNGTDGSLAVTGMTNGMPLGNFTYTWYSANYNNSLPPTDAANTALIVTDATPGNADLTDRAAGTYWVVAQHNTTQCYSLPRSATVVEDIPVMYIPGTVPLPFITCTGSNDGQITVEIVDAPGAVNFRWFTGHNNTDLADEILTGIDNATPGSSTISNLVAGDYTVQAIDATGQACEVSASFTIDSRVMSPELLASRIKHQTSCNADGGAQIDKITLLGDNGTAETLTNYDIEWYVGTADVAGSTNFTALYASNNLNAYNALMAGTYYVRAVPKGTFSGGCATNFAQIVIEDKSTPLQVTGEIFNNYILACDPSLFDVGEIEIEVLDAATFTTAWYQGEVVDEAQRIASADNAVNVQGLAPGTYTVRVVNTDTDCEAIRQYTVEGISVPLDAFPSAQPQISCTANDGAVGVAINGGRGNYTVRWYAGTDTTADPINPNGSYVVEGIGSGTYTVAVTDDDDASCGTIVRQVEVADRSGNDVAINVGSDIPMTNCDNANPNGQLSAMINDPDKLFRYEFFWYAGDNTSGNPIAYGPTATALGEDTYTVIARDRVTGCLSDPYTGAVATLLDSGLLPAPTARMVSPVTRCTEPNGSAEAMLDSTLTIDPNIEYEFIWYNAQGEVVYSSSRTHVASQLDTGMYSVVVRNTISGCLSAPGEVRIVEDIYVPEFEITTMPSFCDQPSGRLSLELLEAFNVVNIEWTTPYGFNNGFYLDNQPAGIYVATLTDANGCQTTREARVLPGIQVYNAVSPNGDQKNDIFTISCIGDFENNVVRIYNRAGSLVYEHVGYDNETIFFEGFGNRGVYIGRKELPDGTYFYVVDKRNGDEPESGYLELLR